MDKQEIYEQYFDEMCRHLNLEDASEAEINRILERLISCLPNDGKFYKYRMGQGKSFDYAFESLSQGYIWCAQACTLNDDFDSTVNFDPVDDINDVKDYLIRHPQAMFVAAFRSAYENGDETFRFFENEISDRIMQQVITCYDLNTGTLNNKRAIQIVQKYGYTKTEAVEWLDKVEQWVNTYIAKNESALAEIVEKHLSFNNTLRSITYVFSVSECYDSDTMWGYYSGNRGFCIEYDYQKVWALPFEIKKKLISFFKVIYTGKKERCSFLPYLIWILGGKQDETLLFQANKTEITQILTKQESWAHEKEWRLVLCETDNRLFADLVSGIYMDESMMETANGKKLIELAKAKNWTLYYRKTNRIGTSHEYVKM